MSSKESPSDGGKKREPSDSDEHVGKDNPRLISRSELASRSEALDREFDRSEVLRKQLKSAKHAVRKLNKEFMIIIKAQEEIWKMLETISDEELINQFWKIMELLGKRDDGMTFLFPKESRLELKRELELVMKETQEYYLEKHSKQYENYKKLHHEFQTVGKRCIKEREILAELGESCN